MLCPQRDDRNFTDGIRVSNKHELLQQLKIDRTTDTGPSGVSASILAWALAVAVGLCLLLAYLWLSSPSTPAGPTADASNAAESPGVTVTQAAPQPGGAEAEDVPAEQTIPAPADANSIILNASGYVTARRIATVSSQVMGLITEVLVEEGMEVESGQVLATLDDALVKADMELAEAQIDVLNARRLAIQADLAEARRALGRVNDNEFSSAAEKTQALARVENLEATLAGSNADIRVARIEVNRRRERLDDHTIRAPFGGVVTVKNAQPGEIVAPTSAGGGFTRTGICTIVDMQSLEIEVDVNEAFIGRVFPGQRVEAKLDAYPSWSIPASVIAIIPTADRSKATVQVRIRIDAIDSRVLPDMGVKVAFFKA
jgi:RND family efflux transporter MFP subunit